MYKTMLFAAAVLSFACSTTAFAEQKPTTGTSGNAQMCKTIYEIYDLNMETYYDKRLNFKQRQNAYNAAKRTLSDFRKRGCKYKDVAA